MTTGIIIVVVIIIIIIIIKLLLLNTWCALNISLFTQMCVLFLGLFFAKIIRHLNEN